MKCTLSPRKPYEHARAQLLRRDIDLTCVRGVVRLQRNMQQCRLSVCLAAFEDVNVGPEGLAVKTFEVDNSRLEDGVQQRVRDECIQVLTRSMQNELGILAVLVI